jgi:hypothetical protein
MQKEMNVRIDQSRQQRAISQIDDLCSSRTLHGRANLDDALALDQYLAGLDDASVLHVEQPCRVQYDGMRRLRLRHTGCRECAQQNSGKHP